MTRPNGVFPLPASPKSHNAWCRREGTIFSMMSLVSGSNSTIVRSYLWHSLAVWIFSQGIQSFLHQAFLPTMDGTTFQVDMVMDPFELLQITVVHFTMLLDELPPVILRCRSTWCRLSLFWSKTILSELHPPNCPSIHWKAFLRSFLFWWPHAISFPLPRRRDWT